MSREPLPLSYRIGERRVDGETLWLDAGASVFVLTTCLADLGLELRGAYLGAERSDEVLVAESGVLGAEPAELVSRRLAEAPTALAEQRRRLLYDHLHAVQDLALRGGWSLGFEGLRATAAALDPHCAI